MSQSDESDLSEEEELLTPPEITEKAKSAVSYLLPDKSKKLYERAYDKFMEWRLEKKIASFSEDVLIVYFEELSCSMKPSCLWVRYSMLKSTLNLNNKIDISSYSRLVTLIKRKCEGYTGKKSRILSSDEIKKFIHEAPDHHHLLTKVVLIFGIMGGCRRKELHDLKVDHVKDVDSLLLVNITNTNTKTFRSFTITGKYYNICKKYMDLRPVVCDNYFFLNYRNGKCNSQNIGINKLGGMAKQVAAYLKLPNSHLYTGHCFRRTSATLQVDAGGNILTLQRRGGLKSATVTEGYVDDSLQHKVEVTNSVEHDKNKVNITTKESASASTSLLGGIYRNISDFEAGAIRRWPQNDAVPSVFYFPEHLENKKYDLRNVSNFYTSYTLINICNM